MSLPTYAALPSEPPAPVSIQPFELEAEDLAVVSQYQEPASGWLSRKGARTFFISSCILSLAISATNLSYLSGLSAFYTLREHGTRVSRTESQRPSVYIGLESVPVDASRCRSRVGYPGTVYTYDTRESRAVLTRVHGPEDNVTLTFGGPIRAVMDMYIADYGLESCTLSLRLPEERVKTAKIDTYLLPSVDTMMGCSWRLSQSPPERRVNHDHSIAMPVFKSGLSGDVRKRTVSSRYLSKESPEGRRQRHQNLGQGSVFTSMSSLIANTRTHEVM